MPKVDKMNLHLEHFLEMMAIERAASKNTLQAYRTDIGQYIGFLSKKNADIDNSESFPNYITQQLGSFGNRTVSRKMSAIKQFYQFLVDEGEIGKNPAMNVPFPKKEKLLPKSLSYHMLDKLFAKARLDDSPEGLRLYCILEILYSTGLRISELVSLKTTDLNRYQDDGSLCEHTVIKGKGSKDRVIILNQKACAALEKFLAVRSKFVPKAKIDSVLWLFPSIGKKRQIVHISRQRIGQLLKELALKANVTPELLSPHKLRHTFASHMVQNGANLKFVQELMGHSDISSTQIYTKVENSAAQNLVLKKHPLGRIVK